MLTLRPHHQLAVSAPIDVLQLAIPGRTTSVDDVLLHVAGPALGGYLAARDRRPLG